MSRTTTLLLPCNATSCSMSSWTRLAKEFTSYSLSYWESGPYFGSPTSSVRQTNVQIEIPHVEITNSFDMEIPLQMFGVVNIFQVRRKRVEMPCRKTPICVGDAMCFYDGLLLENNKRFLQVLFIITSISFFFLTERASELRQIGWLFIERIKNVRCSSNVEDVNHRLQKPLRYHSTG